MPSIFIEEFDNNCKVGSSNMSFFLERRKSQVILISPAASIARLSDLNEQESITTESYALRRIVFVKGFLIYLSLPILNCIIKFFYIKRLS